MRRQRSIARKRPAKPRRPGRRWLAFLGPGLITGASDDDPSGIATYSQAGAQFGFDMAWTMLFSYPLMAAMQEISARIGRVTGHGIVGAMRGHYPSWLLQAIVGLVLVANIINLGADLGGMADSLSLLIGGPWPLYVAGFAVLCAWLETFVTYRRYVAILKWATLSLFAYVATVLVVDVPWATLGARVLVPTVTWSKDYLVTIVAVLGTTISPYLFFWQASQEAEDERIDRHAHPLRRHPEEAPAELRRIRLDTYVGMGFSNLISLCIIVTTAATLSVHGVTDIATSAQAAEALRPIAGPFAFALFALGILGTGLLAVPVLAGSAAYALAESRGWRIGLARRPREAKAFYGTIAVATLAGILINFVGVDPIKALFWTAVINGLVAVPLMAMMMVIGSEPKIMGSFTLPLPLKLLGWLATAAMAATAAVTAWSWIA
jgi:NRAMP (natural resistance-associated macrophage protein)-like metal ion transporter